MIWVVNSQVLFSVIFRERPRRGSELLSLSSSPIVKKKKKKKSSPIVNTPFIFTSEEYEKNDKNKQEKKWRISDRIN